MPATYSAPEIVAHRGGAHAAPENTLAAFNQGWEDGADGVEGDFLMTKDGHVVCIHDKNTAKLADRELVVTSSTLAELKTLDVGIKKGVQWEGERIPTLEEVVATIPAGKKIYIEIKDSERIVVPIKTVLEKTGLNPDQVVIIAFSRSVVSACKKHMPNIKAQWIINQKTYMKEGDEEIIRLAKAIGADGIDTEAHRGVSEAFVSKLKKAGLELNCWTVNDVKTGQRFAELGFDALTTDRPKLIREGLVK
jgi:glycerophosphoryl diester phosphodiesterase